MVAKNPFLCEKDHDIQFVVRNEGAYRGLSSLFPAASLSQIINIASICEKRKLYSSPYVYKVGYRGQQRLRSEVTQATKTLSKELGDSITYQTYQNYLNLACDFRIMRRLPGAYSLHSYGLPLVAVAKWKEWAFSSCLSENLSLVCYFIDRLLFEDGDYIVAVMELINDGVSGKASSILGCNMHDAVFSRLQERAKALEFDHSVRNFLLKKIDEYNKIKKISDRSFRRTELEYTVRRGWLQELGIVSNAFGGEIKFTERGKRLFEKLRKQRLDNSFFTDRIFSILSEVYDMRKLDLPSLISILEDSYKKLTNGHRTILETLVLVNAVLFSTVPFFVGERSVILSYLKRASLESRTRLVLQSGYRTKDYYVKLKF